MQPEIYKQMARLEHEHFWFRARRKILLKCLQIYLPSNTPKLTIILDAGCGTGANLEILSQFGNVVGVELHRPACRYAALKFPGQILQGNLEKLPLQDGCCSGVVLLDVLEHIDDQQSVLGELSRILSPGGIALITVPAFRHLWSGHDITHEHRRRYRAGELQRELAQAGMQVVYLSYFNIHLYPLIALARLLGRFRKTRPTSDMQLPPAWLNYFLYYVFHAERLWIGRFVAPFGVSLIALAKKSH